MSWLTLAGRATLTFIQAVTPELNEDGCWRCRAQGSAELLLGAAPESVMAFEKSRTCRFYARGTMLYQQGSCGGSLFCVNSGLIKIFRTDVAGLVQVVRLAGAGAFFGFRRVLGGRASSNSAQVVAPSMICQIPGEVILAAVSRDFQVARNIITAQARALEQTEAHLMRMVGLSSRGRVASLILEHSAPTPPYLVSPLTRGELAELGGTSIESVSRVIRELARQGCLKLKGRGIYLLDRVALENFVAREHRL